MTSFPTFAIRLSRLPGIEAASGLIQLMVDSSEVTESPTKIGVLTDAALRGRLAHFGAHSANEIAAIRKALAMESGAITVYEDWPGLDGCRSFWQGFVGSQIRPLAWTCDGCHASVYDEIGGTVGESFLRRCRCGEVARITIPK